MPEMGSGTFPDNETDALCRATHQQKNWGSERFWLQIEALAM